MDDLLSIIILTYKNGSLLHETIESIFEQDYPAIELIVCDDATPGFDTGELERFIAEKKKGNIVSSIIIANETNAGTVRNLNNGIRRANGAYIKAIAGDDQLAAPDVCSRQIAYLKTHGDTAVVAGNIMECDAAMTPVSQSGFLLKDDTDPLFRNREKMLKYVCRENQKALATQVLCFRKDFFDKHGLYDESFFLTEDLPMAVRIVEKEEKIGYLNCPCAKHRGETGVSTSAIAFDPRRIRYYEDLEHYFASLVPLQDIIGRRYVQMRRRVCQFRIEYCQLQSASLPKKLAVIFKYLIPLTYYFTTNLRRACFYLAK